MADYTRMEPKFDFAKNEFAMSSGQFIMISGKDLLMQKIEKAIRTEFGRYKIYEDVDYGIPLESVIIGKALPRNYVKSEIERLISEAILKLDGVISVNSFEVIQDGALLTVSFYVNSEFGNIHEEGISIGV